MTEPFNGAVRFVPTPVWRSAGSRCSRPPRRRPTLPGITAGRHISIKDTEGLNDATGLAPDSGSPQRISLTGFIQMGDVTPGWLDVNVDGAVNLEEVSGDLRVGLVRSRTDNVRLVAVGSSILDGNPADPVVLDPQDVEGVNILLVASEWIGTQADFLETNLLDVVNGVIVSGVLEASAGTGAFLEEVAGDLRAAARLGRRRPGGRHGCGDRVPSGLDHRRHRRHRERRRRQPHRPRRGRVHRLDHERPGDQLVDGRSPLRAPLCHGRDRDLPRRDGRRARRARRDDAGRQRPADGARHGRTAGAAIGRRRRRPARGPHPDRPRHAPRAAEQSPERRSVDGLAGRATQRHLGPRRHPAQRRRRRRSTRPDRDRRRWHDHDLRRLPQRRPRRSARR